MDRRRNNPLRGFVDMASEMNRIRHLGLYGPDPAQENLHRSHSSAWVPTADVSGRGADLVIRIELPGVRREEIEITFDEGELNVFGERLSDPDEEEFFVQERYYGVFRRTMTLPPGISEDDISADFRDGLLEITVENGATTAPRPNRIRIG